jgi:type VI secretion system secreted protein VgrG
MSNDNQDSSNKPQTSEGGGAGETPAWSNPDIVMSAPGGITGVTPESISLNAGQTTSIAAGQDIALVAGANASHLVKYGISLFAYGKASNPNKPNQETGIKLHAASGKLSSQSQSDKTSITTKTSPSPAPTTP